MIFIILSIFLNLLIYYFLFSMYGFIVSNAIMVIIKTVDYKYRNILYVKMKNNNFINNQLTYLENKALFSLGVLETENYLNDNIEGRYFKRDFGL